VGKNAVDKDERGENSYSDLKKKITCIQSCGKKDAVALCLTNHSATVRKICWVKI